MSLVKLEMIQKSFKGKNRSDITILRDIDLEMAPHETLCVVGESGCGKTTLGRILAGLLSYTAGSYEFDGIQVSTISGKTKRKFRQDVQLIHQNPYESLNPTMMIYDIIANPIKRHRGITKTAELYAEVKRLLEMVGLTPVEDFVDKYPSRLSGGQRQRVSIARAFAMDPRLIVVDEATSMIDTSLRISLLTTLKEIQAKTGVSYFFITHDLALGRYFAQDQKIMVMYLGRVIEKANTEDFIRRPAHPYSKAILSAAVGNSDLLEASTEFEKYSLKGADIPSFTNVPPGCPLHPRCPQMMPGICDRVVPNLITLGPGHTVSCHLYDPEVMEAASMTDKASTQPEGTLNDPLANEKMSGDLITNQIIEDPKAMIPDQLILDEMLSEKAMTDVIPKVRHAVAEDRDGKIPEDELIEAVDPQREITGSGLQAGTSDQKIPEAEPQGITKEVGGPEKTSSEDLGLSKNFPRKG